MADMSGAMSGATEEDTALLQGRDTLPQNITPWLAKLQAPATALTRAYTMRLSSLTGDSGAGCYN